jgi:hypothetical protein
MTQSSSSYDNQVGLVIIAINGSSVEGLKYEEVVSRLKTNQRPLDIRFRRASYHYRHQLAGHWLENRSFFDSTKMENLPSFFTTTDTTTTNNNNNNNNTATTRLQQQSYDPYRIPYPYPCPDPKLETRNLKPEPEPSTLNPQPSTLNPNPKP